MTYEKYCQIQKDLCDTYSVLTSQKDGFLYIIKQKRYKKASFSVRYNVEIVKIVCNNHLTEVEGFLYVYTNNPDTASINEVANDGVYVEFMSLEDINENINSNFLYLKGE